MHLMIDPRVRAEEFKNMKVMDPRPERLFYGSGIIGSALSHSPLQPTAHLAVL